MPDTFQAPVAADPAERLLVAARLQEIEANPLSAEDIAMFAMFEREGWSPARRRAYILDKAAADA